MNPNLPTDPQQIADDLARAMGMKLRSVLAPIGHKSFLIWIENNGKGLDWRDRRHWNPCTDYNDCRVVEDWFEQCEVRWHELRLEISGIDGGILRSTAKERCEKMWLIAKEKGLIP